MIQRYRVLPYMHFIYSPRALAKRYQPDASLIGSFCALLSALLTRYIVIGASNVRSHISWAEELRK